MVKIAISGGRKIDYVERYIWTESNGAYELVSLEERIKNALEYYRFALLMGLSGIGKSTTAEYIARFYAERRWIIVKLIPVEAIEDFRFEVVVYNKIFCVLNIYLSRSYIGSEERLNKLALAISKVSAKSIVKDEKRFCERLKGFINRIKELLGRKDLEKILSTTDHGVKILNDLNELAKDFEQFEYIRELNAEEAVKVVEVIGDLSRKLGLMTVKDVLKALKDVLPSVSMILCLVLFMLGIIEIKELLGKRGIRKEIFERLKKTVEKIEKEDKRILLIVDDFYRVENKGILLDFLELCYLAGFYILVVRRLSLEGEYDKIIELIRTRGANRTWRAVNIFRYDKISDESEKLWGILGYKELKSCVSIVFSINEEEFIKIVKVNWELIREIREKLNKEKDLNLKLKFEDIKSDLGEWYRKTAGIPHLALSLMCYIDVKDLKLEDVGMQYLSKPFFELSEEDTKMLMNTFKEGYVNLYRLLRERDFSMIPVLLQAISADEAEEFFSKVKKGNLEDLKWKAKRGDGIRVYKEAWIDENGVKKYIDVYDLAEFNLKLRDIFEALADYDEALRDELTRYKKLLLEIMTKNSLDTGITAIRRILFAIMHCEFLTKYGFNVSNWYLFWLTNALQHLPDLGIAKAFCGIELAKSGNIYALAFLNKLAQVCRLYVSDDVLKIILGIWDVLKTVKADSDILKALKIMVKSSLLSAIFRHMRILQQSKYKIKEIKDLTNVNEILKRFEDLEDEAKNLRFLSDLVLTCILSDKAEILMHIMPKLAKDILKQALDICKNIKIDISKDVRDLVKPLGWNRKKNFEKDIRSLEASIYYKLGIVLKYLGEFKIAKEMFKESAKIWSMLNIHTESLKCKSRIERVCILEGVEPNFSDLFKESKNIWIMLDMEFKSCICAERLVSLALKDNKLDENDIKDIDFCYNYLTFEDRAITSGVLQVLEPLAKEFKLRYNKEQTIKMLEDFDMYLTLGLTETINGIVKLIENFEEYLVKAELEGRGEWFLRDIAKLFGGLDLLKQILEIFKKDKKRATELIEHTIMAESSLHAFARILRLYLEGFKDKAGYLALVASRKYINDSPCLGRLFGEIAEALEKDNKNMFKSAVIKLFYYHI